MSITVEGADSGTAPIDADDRFGDQVLADLRAAGVDTTLVLPRTDVRTGLTVVLAPPVGERAMLTQPGAIPTLTTVLALRR